MKTYLEVSISATESQRELLLPSLVELGFEGFQEMDTDLLGYIDKERWSADKETELRDALKKILQTISSNADIRFKEIEDRNWNEEWEKTIQPIEIGERIVIKPSWCEYPATPGKIVLEIDPKMSFGTGYHETTRLVLQLMQKYVQAGDRVLDVGTGTGVLAIASVKLGAAYAYGVDIDAWSIDNAQENVGRNNVTDTVRIDDTPTEKIAGEYDLIAGNLTLNVNSALLIDYRRLLKPGGVVLLSGLLSVDEPEIRRRLAEERFNVSEMSTENEWIAIAATKGF